MKIKQGKRTFNNKSFRKDIYILLLIVLFLGYSLGIVAFGAWSYKTGKWSSEITPIVLKIFNYINYLKSTFTVSPKLLKIDIEHEHFQRLAYDRELALHKGRLFGNKYVPAQITFNGKAYKMKIRLKGDNLDHLKSPEKWSFRIQVKKPNTMWGMKRFSLQSPQTRNYAYEWIYHQLLKKEDIISLFYDFVRVNLNGKDLGIYALEEHFDKILIESNQRREGPILKFNENLFWEDNVYKKKRSSGLDMQSVSNIEPFKSNSILSDPNLRKQFFLAKDLLELFRRGELESHQVFDIDRLAKFFVLSELTKTAHGAFVWGNLRFYYNPITSLLEPVGFDGVSGEEKIVSMWSAKRMQDVSYSSSDVLFYHQIFNDVLFFKKYAFYTEKYTKPEFLVSFLEEIRPILQEKLNILYSDYPQIDGSQIDEFEKIKSVFSESQVGMKNLFNPIKGIHAYLQNKTDSKVEISFGNIQIMPIEVIGIYSSGKIYFLQEKLIIAPKMNNNPVNFIKKEFLIPQKEQSEELRVIYKVLGTSQERTALVFPYPHLSSNLTENDLIRRSANVFDFDFLHIENSSKRIIIRSGRWELDKDLVIPGGYSVIAGEGVQINLSNNATILSYSPFYFKGTEENPILIQSKDKSGNGMVIIGAQTESFLEHVIFKNLSSPQDGDWSLTGAITFYESPVLLSFVRFEGNRSEDALNIIRSNFVIQNSEFSDTKSDAFDGDFVHGSINNTFFNNCGNDGIDISGSTLEVRKVFINKAGDKGISAGESSTLKINDTSILHAEIAVASKDQSDIFINNTRILDSKIGLTSFQKKPEFGPSSIIANVLDVKNSEIPFLVEERSVIQVDGKFIQPNKDNVKNILYGVEYGKSSK